VIIATAPGRCGIVGNPTDMYGGCVISVRPSSALDASGAM